MFISGTGDEWIGKAPYLGRLGSGGYGLGDQ